MCSAAIVFDWIFAVSATNILPEDRATVIIATRYLGVGGMMLPTLVVVGVVVSGGTGVRIHHARVLLLSPSWSASVRSVPVSSDSDPNASDLTIQHRMRELTTVIKKARGLAVAEFHPGAGSLSFEGLAPTLRNQTSAL